MYSHMNIPLIYMEVTELESLRTHMRFSKYVHMCHSPHPIPSPRPTLRICRCPLSRWPRNQAQNPSNPTFQAATSERSELASKMKLFIIPVPDSRTLTGSRESGFEQSWKLCLLFAHSLFILTVRLIPVSFISCHLIYHSTAWKSKLIKSWDFTGVNSTNSRKPGYRQKKKKVT